MWYYSLHLIWEEMEEIKKILRLGNMVYAYCLKNLRLSMLISFIRIKEYNYKICWPFNAWWWSFSWHQQLKSWHILVQYCMWYRNQSFVLLWKTWLVSTWNATLGWKGLCCALYKTPNTHWNPIYTYLIQRQSCHHIETSQLICRVNKINWFVYGFWHLIS